MLKFRPKVNTCKPFGNVTPSRHWMNLLPNVKFCNPDGQVTPSKRWLKFMPKVNVCKLCGKVTWSKLWLKRVPRIKVFKPCGRMLPSKRLLKAQPKAKLCKPSGNATRFNSWSKLSPSVKLWRPFGNSTRSKLSLKRWPNTKVCKHLGKTTPRKSWLNSSPKSSFCKPSGKIKEYKNRLRLRHPRFSSMSPLGSFTSTKSLALRVQASAVPGWVNPRAERWDQLQQSLQLLAGIRDLRDLQGSAPHFHLGPEHVYHAGPNTSRQPECWQEGRHRTLSPHRLHLLRFLAASMSHECSAAKIHSEQRAWCLAYQVASPKSSGTIPGPTWKEIHLPTSIVCLAASPLQYLLLQLLHRLTFGGLAWRIEGAAGSVPHIRSQCCMFASLFVHLPLLAERDERQMCAYNCALVCIIIRYIYIYINTTRSHKMFVLLDAV